MSPAACVAPRGKLMCQLCTALQTCYPTSRHGVTCFVWCGMHPCSHVELRSLEAAGWVRHSRPHPAVADGSRLWSRWEPTKHMLFVHPRGVAPWRPAEKPGRGMLFERNYSAHRRSIFSKLLITPPGRPAAAPRCGEAWGNRRAPMTAIHNGSRRCPEITPPGVP